MQSASLALFSTQKTTQVGYPPSRKKGEFVRLNETNQTLQVIQRIMTVVYLIFVFTKAKTGIPFL